MSQNSLESSKMFFYMDLNRILMPMPHNTAYRKGGRVLYISWNFYVQKMFREEV